MSFETIQVIRHVPVINGFLQLPNNLERHRSAMSLKRLFAIISPEGAAESTFRMSGGTNGPRATGGKHGSQEWLGGCGNPVGPGDSFCPEMEDVKALLD